MRDRTQKLVATQEALVDAERFAAMGKTSAAIAHEIKNTLNGLGMAVELIVQDPANTARVARLRPQVVGRDRAPARRGRLAAVVLALAAHRAARSADLVRGDRARRATLLADLVADRGATVSIDAPADAAALLRRAQDAGRAW